MRDYTFLMPFLAREEGYDLCMRVLSFYNEQNCEGNILIALTGSEAEKSRFKDLLRSRDFSGRVYEHAESSADILGVHIFYDKMLKAAELIETEYVAIISADDFIIPDAVANACRVLENDETISSCSGRGLLYNPSADSVAIYPQIARMEKEAGERLSLYIRKPTALFYSTYRTVDLVAALKQASTFLMENKALIKRNISFSEHIFSFFIVISGRLYVQDVLYFVRLQNPQQTGRKAPSILASYIMGDVDEFIDSAAKACGRDLLDIRESYREYIYLKGASNPKYALVNARLFLRNPLRALDLFWNSCLSRIKNGRVVWTPDSGHTLDQSSEAYQAIMRHLL